MIRLYDTATREVHPLEPRVPGTVSMYVCGPTVYGPAHLGHGRFSLVFDVLRRYLLWSGLEVVYVSNITDIDDKIIARAEADGTSTEDVANRWEAVWWQDMDAIGVLRPTHTPHATEYVEQMVALIADLIERGVAYQTSDGVYFSPEHVDDYGLLIHQPLESLRAGARVTAAEEKRSPVDFALWKTSKPGEPSWPSPWGPGRPGWHTECVVMSLDLLGEGFDLHGGGQDLAFPHHENERAQAVAAGRRFATRWVHNGFVEVAGEKMSKSLGNFSTVADLVERSDPRSFRLLVLRSHYRSPLEVNEANATDASKALAGLDALARRAAAAGIDAELDAEVLDAFRAHMDDDLDSPAAMALVFSTARRANQAFDDGDAERGAALAATVVELCAAVGLELVATVAEVPDDVAARARARDEARAARDWARADALRDELVAEGWTVEDTPDGTVVRPA
jgi:cysteinyl-tRNA synthetase